MVAHLERSMITPMASFVERSPSAVCLTDGQMQILHHSRAWVELLGLGDGPVIGRSLYDDAVEGQEHFRAAYDWCLSGQVLRSERIELKRTDGAPIWCDVDLVPWEIAPGKVGGLVISIFPVTEVVYAVEQQQRSERRLKLAAKLAALHVWEVDYTRGTLENSGEWHEVVDREFTFQSFMADPMAVCHPDDIERVLAHYRQDHAAGVTTPVEYRVNRMDGRTLWVSGITEYLVEDGAPVRVVGAVQDITARKLAEIEMAEAHQAAEEASRAKSAFLATVSHEIRTPMNGVLGMAQAMEGDELTPLQRERLDVIRQSGESLLAVLNDVLDLSKIEAGKLSLEETEFGLSALARGAHAAFTAVAEQKGLPFDLVISDAAKGRYRGDATRIRQILYNLISNALKFTAEGWVRVDVGREAGELVITVADSGVGIAPDVLGSLFQKFVQADASTTRQFGGTGLGLAICRELAELMGGCVAADSAPDKGATFRVRLPLERLGDEASVALRERAHAARPEPSRERLAVRILAAEDNRINQLVLKTLLLQIGLDPLFVDDGQAAVEAWEREDWDVILMDVQMPRLDGPAAARHIRRREGELGRRRTPIIALTANTMTHQVDDYLACGMDGVVGKPFNITDLYNTLARVLDPAGAKSEAA